MHRRIKSFAALLIVLILALGSVPVYAENELSIKVDGAIYALSSTTAKEEGVLLIGMFDTFKLLHAQFSWNQSKRTGIAARGDKEITFTAGSKEAFLNGEAIQLPVAPKTAGDTMMVPLQAVTEALGARFHWDERTNVVTITTGAGELSILDRTSQTPIGATVLSYNTAVQRAIKTNSNLKNLEKSLDILEAEQGTTKKNLRDAWQRADQVAANLELSGGYETYRSALVGAVSLMRAEYALKNQVSNYKLNEQIIKDSSTYMLRNSLTIIAGYEMDIQMLEALIALGEKNIANLELKRSLGMTSDNEVRTAKQNQQQNILNLEQVAILLSNEKQSLNNLLDYALTTDVAVQWEPTAAPLTENLSGYIGDWMKKDPSIQMKEKEVENAKYTITTSWGVLNESKSKNDSNLTIVAQNLEDAKKNLEKTILNTYNTIQQLDEYKRSLELDLEKARDNYNTVVVSYEAGQATLYDVEQVKLAILQAEIALEKCKYNYSNLVFAFERPYLLTAGA